MRCDYTWLRTASAEAHYPYALAGRLPELFAVLTESDDAGLQALACESLADLSRVDRTSHSTARTNAAVISTLSTLAGGASDASLRLRAVDAVRVLMSSVPAAAAATNGPAARGRRRAKRLADASASSSTSPSTRSGDDAAPYKDDDEAKVPPVVASPSKTDRPAQRKKRRARGGSDKAERKSPGPAAAASSAAASPSTAARQRLPRMGSVLLADELPLANHRGHALRSSTVGYSVPLVWAPQRVQDWRVPAAAGELRMVSRRDVPPHSQQQLPAPSQRDEAAATVPAARARVTGMRAIIAGAATAVADASATGAAADAAAKAVTVVDATPPLASSRAPLPRHQSWTALDSSPTTTDANFTTALLDGMETQLARAQQSYSSAERSVHDSVLEQRTTDIALLRFRLERAKEGGDEEALRVAELDYAHWVQHFCLPKLARIVAVARRLQLRAGLTRMREALEHVAFFKRLPQFRLRAAAALLHEPMLLAFERFKVFRKARRFRFWRDLVRSEEAARREEATPPLQRAWRCYFARERTMRIRMGHWGAVILQTSYRRLYRKKAYLHKLSCMLIMQSIVRKHSWRRWFMGVRRHAVRQQSMGRMVPRRLHFKLQRRAVRILQNQLRGHLGRFIVASLRLLRWRNFERRWTAALALQRDWRARMARRMTSHTLNDQEHVFEAALMLQRTWYRHNGEFSTWILLCALRVRDELDRVNRRTERHDNRFESATTIQARARGIMTRVRFYHTRTLLRSGLLIQQTYRAWKARVWFLLVLRTNRAAKAMQRAIRRRQMRRFICACRLQRAWWRWCWRSLRAYARDAPVLSGKMRGLRFRAVSNPAASHVVTSVARAKHDALAARRRAMDAAADGLVRAWRCRFSRWRLMRHLKARDMERVVRGHLGRERAKLTYLTYRVDAATRLLDRVFPYVLPRSANQLWWRRRQAATIIQRCTRSFLVRIRWIHSVQLAQLRENSASKIQHTVRVFWGHRSLLVVRKRLHEVASNRFRTCGAIAPILQDLQRRCAALWSPDDAIVGMSLATWFRRIGVVKNHLAVDTVRRVLGAAASVPAIVAALRNGGDHARILRKALGTEDWETCRHFFEMEHLADAPDFRVASTEEAEILFLERFPGKQIRASNWAASALLPGSGLSVGSLKILLANSAESGETKHRLHALLSWEEDDALRDEQAALNKDRVLKFIRLHVMALRRCADVADVDVDLLKAAILGLAETGASTEVMRSFLESASAHSTLRDVASSFGAARRLPRTWRCATATTGNGKRPITFAEATRLHTVISSIETAESAAVRLQTSFRARLARNRLVEIRRQLRLDELRNMYSEEATRDKVKEAWKADRERERLEYEAWMEEQRRTAITERLQVVVPFGWLETWDEAEQAYFYTDSGGNVQWEHPTYTWHHDDAAVVVQRHRRGVLGRITASIWTKYVGRQRRRDAAAVVWDVDAPKRARRVTIALSHDAAKDDDVDTEPRPTPASRNYVGEQVLVIVDKVKLHRSNREWLRGISFSIANLAAEKSERRQSRKRSGRDKKHKNKRVKYRPDLASEMRMLANDLIGEAIAGMTLRMIARSTVEAAHSGELTFVAAPPSTPAGDGPNLIAATDEEPVAVSTSEADPPANDVSVTFAFVAEEDAEAYAVPSKKSGRNKGKKSKKKMKKGGKKKKGKKRKAKAASDKSSESESESSVEPEAKTAPIDEAAAVVESAESNESSTASSTMLQQVRQDTVDSVTSILHFCLRRVDIEVELRAKIRAENASMVKSLTKEIVKNCAGDVIRLVQERHNIADRAIEAAQYRVGWITSYNAKTGRHLIILDAISSPRAEPSAAINGDDDDDDLSPVTKPKKVRTRRTWYWCSLTAELRRDRIRLIESTVHANVTVALTVSWVCRYGWQSPESEDPDERYYWNAVTGETSWTHPDYEFQWVLGCGQAQRLWRGKQGRRRVRSILGLEGADTVLTLATKKSINANTWIGYGIEGMSARMWMDRLGFPDLAVTLYDSKIKSPQLSIAQLRQMDEAQLGALAEELSGRQAHRARIAKFVKLLQGQAHRSTTRAASSDSRRVVSPEHRALALVTGPDSAVGRSATGIALHDIQGPLTLFKRTFPNYAGARCTGFASAMAELNPPVSVGALQNHLRKYAGKAATAQSELTLLKATAFQSTAAAEERCARAYFAALNRVAVLTACMPIKRLYKQLRATCRAARVEIQRLEETSAAVASYTEDALRTHGGTTEWMPLALILRQKMDTVFAWTESAVRVQTFQRCHVLRRRYDAIMFHKNQAATVAQCAVRSFLSRGRTHELRRMYNAEWEQCWEPTQGAYFYFHMETEEVQWTLEEGVAFRPFGMWPQVSRDQAAPPPEDGMCSWCRDKRAVRQCRQCTDTGGHPQQFCFLCYVRVHTDPTDEPKKAHRWDPLEGAGEPTLCCVVCSDEATRWCDDCSEAFCAVDHELRHAKKKRMRAHRWSSLFRRAPACSECASLPAKRHCNECADAFCVGCYDTVHQKGYRRRHAHEPVRAEVAGEQVLCEICSYAIGSKLCIHCSMALCPGCLEFEHPPTACPELDLDIVAAEDKIAAATAICVECGPETAALATRLCDQTQKPYCTLRWIGNPGCFEKAKTARGPRGKKWTCSMHPGVRIREATRVLQGIGRSMHARKQHEKLRRERASEVLGRATRRFLLRREGKKLHKHQKKLGSRLLRGTKRIKASVWRARHSDEVGISKRSVCFETVKNSWDAAEGNKQDLDEAIQEEMKRIGVPEDRQDVVLRWVRGDVLAFHRAKM